MQTVQDDTIYAVYNILRDKLKRCGKEVALPMNTDHKKTYSWRHLENFVRKMESLKIPRDNFPLVIGALVSYAKNRKLLNRGFAVLSKSDMVDLIVKKLETDIRIEDQVLSGIKNSHKFLTMMPMPLNGRKRPVSYMNITIWYEQGKISKPYIAMSRACRRALREMTINERSLYPTDLELMKMKMRLLSKKQELQEILGADLLT